MKEATSQSPVKGSPTPEALGARLRERRESLSRTIDDAAAATCIRKNFLEDIEKGDFSRFKALVYARGFVRNYLEYLDASELWTEYNSLLTLDLFETVRKGSSPHHAGKGAGQKVSMLPPASLRAGAPLATPARGFRHSRLRRNCILVLVVLLAAGAAALWMNWDRFNDEISRLQQDQAYLGQKNREAEQSRHDEQRRAEVEAARQERIAQKVEEAAPAQPEPVAPEPVVKSEVEPVVEPAPVPQKPVLTLRATGDCWLRVTQDGKKIFESTVRRGWQQTFNLDSTVTTRFGRGQYIEASTNGQEFSVFPTGVGSYEFFSDGSFQRK